VVIIHAYCTSDSLEFLNQVQDSFRLNRVRLKLRKVAVNVVLMKKDKQSNDLF